MKGLFSAVGILFTIVVGVRLFSSRAIEAKVDLNKSAEVVEQSVKGAMAPQSTSGASSLEFRYQPAQPTETEAN